MDDINVNEYINNQLNQKLFFQKQIFDEISRLNLVSQKIMKEIIIKTEWGEKDQLVINFSDFTDLNVVEIREGIDRCSDSFSIRREGENPITGVYHFISRYKEEKDGIKINLGGFFIEVLRGVEKYKDMDERKKIYIVLLFYRQEHKSVKKFADILGICRTTLQDWIGQYRYYIVRAYIRFWEFKEVEKISKSGIKGRVKEREEENLNLNKLLQSVMACIQYYFEI